MWVNCAQLSRGACVNVVFCLKLLVCAEYQMIWAASLRSGLFCFLVICWFILLEKRNQTKGLTSLMWIGLNLSFLKGFVIIFLDEVILMSSHWLFCHLVHYHRKLKWTIFFQPRDFIKLNKLVGELEVIPLYNLHVLIFLITIFHLSPDIFR